MNKELKDFILMLADNVMILGQRLGEWCGHGPVLEQDIAMTNIALDLIGEARNYYQYIGETEGIEEDEYVMKRDVRSFRNVLLSELPNGHWGDTIMRQCIFDCYHFYLLQGLTTSADVRLASIAKKSLKESTYHLTYSSEWVIRLGDGTPESNQKMQQSLEDLIPYFDELFLPSEFETYMINLNICPDLQGVKNLAFTKFSSIINEATLSIPTNYYNRYGGKNGMHTEYLGHILSELQFMQRAYPGVQW